MSKRNDWGTNGQQLCVCARFSQRELRKPREVWVVRIRPAVVEQFSLRAEDLTSNVHRCVTVVRRNAGELRAVLVLRKYILARVPPLRCN